MRRQWNTRLSYFYFTFLFLPRVNLINFYKWNLLVRSLFLEPKTKATLENYTCKSWPLVAQITVLRGLSPTLLHDSIFKTQGEANLIFWLATQEVKIAPSCALGISRVSPARKSFFLIWPYNKSFIDRACSVRMADFYWPRLRLARSIK